MIKNDIKNNELPKSQSGPSDQLDKTDQSARSYKQDGTIGKALDVVELVSDFGRPVRLNTLQAKSAYPKGTLYRLLQTLARQGLLSYDAETQRYGLGARLMRLAHHAWRDFSLASVALPHIQSLSSELNRTVHLAQLDAGHVLYLGKISGQDQVPMYSQTGKVGPAYCTGVGKVMLAFTDSELLRDILEQQSWYAFTPNTITNSTDMLEALDQIRRQGYALDEAEHELGIYCVAYPVLSGQGKLLGAISVTDVGERVATIDALLDSREAIKRCAENISHEASCWTFPHTN